MITKESFEEYKSDKRFISPSDIKGCKTPLHYFMKKIVLPKSEPTEAMIIGSAYHTLILEPEKFEQKYVTLFRQNLPNPDKDFRDSANKKYKDDLMKLSKEKSQIILPEETIKQLMDMKVALQTYIKDIDETIIDRQNGLIENNLYCAVIFDELGTLKEFVKITDKEQIDKDFVNKRALFLATRPDYFNYINFYDLDLKTTTDASPEHFAKECYEMEYDIQAAMGLDILTCEYGQEFTDFFFIAQEKTEPYYCANYHCSEEFIQMGVYRYRLRLKRILEATEAGVFPGYEINRNFESKVASAIELYLPKWVQNKVFDF